MYVIPVLSVVLAGVLWVAHASLPAGRKIAPGNTADEFRK
jgi:hypothetical protein